jgi:hypothetical protein
MLVTESDLKQKNSESDVSCIEGAAGWIVASNFVLAAHFPLAH